MRIDLTPVEQAIFEMHLKRRQEALQEAERQQELINFTATEIRKDRDAPDGKATLDDSGDVWALVIEEPASE